MNTPDQYFWYSLAVILGGALIWILQRHIVKTDKLLEKLTEGMNTLNTKTAVHDERIAALEERDEDLADKIVGKLRAITPVNK